MEEKQKIIEKLNQNETLIETNDVTETMTIITDKLGNIYMGIHNFYNSSSADRRKPYLSKGCWQFS